LKYNGLCRVRIAAEAFACALVMREQCQRAGRNFLANRKNPQVFSSLTR
jgi:hypothetical protein